MEAPARREGVSDGEVKGPLNARLLGEGSEGEGLVLGALSSSPVGFRAGLGAGVSLGSAASDPPERAGAGIPVGDADPVPCHLSAVRTQATSKQEAADSSRKGHELLVSRSALEGLLTPPAHCRGSQT